MTMPPLQQLLTKILFRQKPSHILFYYITISTASSFTMPNNGYPSKKSIVSMSTTEPTRKSQQSMGNSAFSNMHASFTTWNTHSQPLATSKCIPPLSHSSHKGSSGRVGVLGGSAQYTGAPYYAAMSALKTGSDLAFVFCADEAAVPIKCYSPELMVAPVYNAKQFDDDEVDQQQQQKMVDEMVEKVTSFLPRMHCLIVGPGLGRCPLVFQATARIMKAAIKANVGLVVDADALFLLTLNEYKHLFESLTGDNRVVLTPNVVEFNRLLKAYCNEENSNLRQNYFEGTPLQHAVIVRKAQSDRITKAVDVNHDEEARELICEEEGGLKRSGGIGDVLAGCVGTFVAWDSILHGSNGANVDVDEDDEEGGDLLLSCWSACCVTKRSTKAAFEKKRRAMTAPDVLEEIGPALEDMTIDIASEESLKSLLSSSL